MLMFDDGRRFLLIGTAERLMDRGDALQQKLFSAQTVEFVKSQHLP